MQGHRTEFAAPQKNGTMRILLLCALLLSSLCSWSQANLVPEGYTQCTWDEITLVDSSFQSADSFLVFVTTRSFKPYKKEFLGNDVSSDSTLRFFTIYFHGNSWKAAPRSTFTAAMNSGKAPSDFVVYSEGDGKTFPDNIDRSTRVSRLYEVGVIMFDWPSRLPEAGGAKNVRNTVRNTRAVAQQYHSFLVLLQTYKSTYPQNISHLSLFCHSMGNAVLKNAIEKYGKTDLDKSFVDNIILNAACVPVKRHNKWLEKLCFQNQIYVLYNRKDKTLRGASLLFGKKLLGCQLKKPLATNALYIDVGQLALTKHNYFLILQLLHEHPSLFTFFHTILHGGAVNVSDPGRFRIKAKGTGYILL